MTAPGVAPWEPASDFERELADAFDRGDNATCFELLMRAQLLLPVLNSVPGADPGQWPIFTDEEGPMLMAFTSYEAMALASGGRLTEGAIAHLDELAADWPDQRVGLAVNPGLRVVIYLESGTVARLAAPPLEFAIKGDDQFTLAFQKAIPIGQLGDFLTSTTGLISGYCQIYWHVEHFASPRALITSLGLSAEEYLNEDGDAFVVRWRGIGLALFDEAYGGETETARDLVAGSIVEEPPFRGLGFGPASGQVIREFKVNAAPLSHDAEVWRIGEAGQQRIGLFDQVIGAWRVVRRRADSPIDDVDED